MEAKVGMEISREHRIEEQEVNMEIIIPRIVL